MKLLIVNGSPRAPRSNSRRYAELFQARWKGEARYAALTAKNHAELAAAAAECTDLLLVFPLYVRQAERQINAQAALLGASKSDWLPQFFLKGSVGYSSHDLKDFTKRSSMTFEIAPSLSWTLFNGTKLVNATRLARAQLDESIHQFNQTVLTAVQETDNAMNGYRNSIKQIVALREVCNQGEETLKLSLDLYKQGLTPFQNVLDALRSLLAYQNQLTQAQGNSLQELISLYKALGGGYGNIISGL